MSKFNDRGIVLYLELASIFRPWDTGTSEAILFTSGTASMLNENNSLLSKLFSFLEEESKTKTACGIFMKSIAEKFEQPYLIIDFATLFDIPDTDIPAYILDIVFDDEEFALGKLRSAAIEPMLFEEKWCFGVIQLSNRFFGNTETFLRVFELDACKENILSLVKDRDFFVGDISKKLTEMKEHQHGFGLFADGDDTLYGFVLYKFENVEAKSNSVQLHIEYICTNVIAPRGTGCQLTVRCVKRAQSKYPGYDINAFAEAKPTAKAIGFWLTKMGFTVDKGSFIDGAYYPSYKMYGGNSIPNFQPF